MQFFYHKVNGLYELYVTKKSTAYPTGELLLLNHTFSRLGREIINRLILTTSWVNSQTTTCLTSFKQQINLYFPEATLTSYKLLLIFNLFPLCYFITMWLEFGGSCSAVLHSIILTSPLSQEQQKRFPTFFSLLRAWVLCIFKGTWNYRRLVKKFSDAFLF